MSIVSVNMQQVKHDLNELLYNSNSINSICENRKKLEYAIEVLENSINDFEKFNNAN